MSRAVNVMATENEMTTLCAELGIGFSVLEPLKSGGLRVVLNNSGDALTIRNKLKKKLIEGPVERGAFYVGHEHIPYR